VERQFREVEAQGLLPREINRFSDYYLKFLLAEPKRKPLLLDLTNSILQSMGYEPLEDLEPMERELSPLIAGGRGLRLDYLGRTPSGRMINLEFQKHGDGDFIKRALFCTSAIIQRQLVQGSDFDALCQTIFVGLLGFDLFEWDGWYWDFVLSNVEQRKILTKDLLLIFVETRKLRQVLPELRRQLRSGETSESELKTRLALWGGYMTNQGVDIMAEVMAKDEIFAQVGEAERDFWGDSRNRYMQWIEEKRERDERHWLTGIERAERRGRTAGLAEGRTAGLAEGRTAGLAEGRTAGLAEGRTAGLAEGRTAGLAEGRTVGLAEGITKGTAKGKIEVARALLTEGVPVGIIQKATGLSDEEIRKLR
jgi:predicted transposase/invertase (TIGR01784 family)